jgi:hypothetical protein
MLERLSAGSDSLDVLGSWGRRSGQALRAWSVRPNAATSAPSSRIARLRISSSSCVLVESPREGMSAAD